MASKCKQIFENQCSKDSHLGNDLFLIRQEIELLKNSLVQIQNEVKILHEKSDHTLGSLTFISNEYDDFSMKLKKFTRENQSITANINFLNGKIASLNDKQNTTEQQLDGLEQYGRRENLEIHGIPESRNESTNNIVKRIAEKLKLKLSDRDISTSHRIPKSKSDLHPPIIVRFSNRDKRNEIFSNRPKSASSLFNANSENYVIKENLTKFRKFLYGEAYKTKIAFNFKFLWTWQGQILLRKNDTSKIFKISSLSDLARINQESGKAKFSDNR